MNLWSRFLAWRRKNKERYAERYAVIPLWVDDAPTGLVLGLFPPTPPALEPGEQRRLASLGSISRGSWDFRRTVGSLWLTDRRLIFLSTAWTRFPFGRKRVEIRREEIISTQLRSSIRSVASPFIFLRTFQLRTADGKSYLVQAHKASLWVNELNALETAPTEA
jgi:hypothetical protein